MHLATVCLISAAAFAVAGTALGSAMGIGGDFTLAHAHAHINLLGWVTLALYGLYHRGVVRENNRLAWVQVGCALIGTTSRSALATPVAAGECAVNQSAGAGA